MQQRSGPFSPSSTWGKAGGGLWLAAPAGAQTCQGLRTSPTPVPCKRGSFEGSPIHPEPLQLHPGLLRALGRFIAKTALCAARCSGGRDGGPHPWGPSALPPSKTSPQKPLLVAQQQLVKGWERPEQIVVSIRRPPQLPPTTDAVPPPHLGCTWLFLPSSMWGN